MERDKTAIVDAIFGAIERGIIPAGSIAVDLALDEDEEQIAKLVIAAASLGVRELRGLVKDLIAEDRREITPEDWRKLFSRSREELAAEMDAAMGRTRGA